MLTRTTKRFFTLRSKRDWVPRIFKHPKYNNPTAMKKAEKKETPEYKEFKKNEIEIFRKVNEKQMSLEFNTKVQNLHKMRLNDYTREEIIYFLKSFNPEKENNHLIMKLGREFLLKYGYDLNMFELNMIMKINFVNHSKMTVAEFVCISGILGKLIGPDTIDIPYIDDAFTPEFFKFLKNQKMFANMLLILSKNYKTNQAIHEKSKCQFILERLLFKTIRVITHKLKQENWEFNSFSLIHIFLICSEYLPVAYFPDSKIIPLSHQYERPSEVLLDKAWTEEVKSVGLKANKELNEAKLRDLAALIRIQMKTDTLDENSVKNITKEIEKSLRFLENNSFDVVYIVNRLVMVHIASTGKFEEINSVIVKTLKKNLKSYISKVEEELDQLINNIGKTWTDTNLNTKSNLKIENAKIILNLNLVLKNLSLIHI